MIDIWYGLADYLLPHDLARYVFMKNALLAVLLVTPVFGVLGTMVVSNRMAFFTEVLGHSALTGIGIGVLLGISDPTLPMIAIAVALAFLVNLLKDMTHSSMDTVMGVFLAFMVALGITILSRQGGVVKFTTYLIGDILAVTPAQIAWLAVLFIIVFVYWYFAGNALILTSVSGSLARSRMIRTFFVETSFTILLAVVVMVSIRLVGILIINSLLVLPAAAARNAARSISSYTVLSICISVFSGICGLFASYYLGTASGATIVLFSVACYGVSALAGLHRRKAFM